MTPSPKVKSNAFYSNSFLIFLTRFFPSLANLAVVVWYARKLPIDTYGIYANFWVHFNVFYPITCFGVHTLIVTYSPGLLRTLTGSTKKSHILLFVSWMILLSGVFAFLEHNSVGIKGIVPFLFLFFYSVSIILESLLIVFRNFKLLVTANIIYSLLFCGIHEWVLRNGFSIQFIFLLLLPVVAARCILYAVAAAKALRKTEPEMLLMPPGPGQIMSLWLHLGIYDVSQSLFSYIDKFVISLTLSVGLSAIYNIGSQNIPFLPLLLSAAGSAALMQLATGKKSDEKTDTIKLMNQTGKILSCIIFPLFFFLAITRNEIMAIFGGHEGKYLQSTPIFLVSLMVIPLRAYSFTTVLQKLHKGAIINIGALLDLLLACALIYPLYHFIGLPGVAMSFVISTYLQAGFYLFYSAKMLSVSMYQLLPLRNWLFKFIVFGSLFIGFRYVSHFYFTGKFTLILGALLMLLLIAISLLLELKSRKKEFEQA